MDKSGDYKAMNLKSIRRENLRALAKSIGGISRLADRLNKSQSQISHLIGNHPIKNIGDKIAAEAELAFNKPSGWLDRKHHTIGEELVGSYVEQNGRGGVLCQQIPLISVEEVRQWDKIAYKYKPDKDTQMIPTTILMGPFAFALKVYGDSMESPTGISFSENSIIIADPDMVATQSAFVVVRVNKDRGATLKQLMIQGNKHYLKPLNRRYPILESTPDTIILGVVRQMVVNFNSPPQRNIEIHSKIKHLNKVLEPEKN